MKFTNLIDIVFNSELVTLINKRKILILNLFGFEMKHSGTFINMSI